MPYTAKDKENIKNYTKDLGKRFTELTGADFPDELLCHLLDEMKQSIDFDSRTNFGGLGRQYYIDMYKDVLGAMIQLNAKNPTVKDVTCLMENYENLMSAVWNKELEPYVLEDRPAFGNLDSYEILEKCRLNRVTYVDQEIQVAKSENWYHSKNLIDYLHHSMEAFNQACNDKTQSQTIKGRLAANANTGVYYTTNILDERSEVAIAAGLVVPYKLLESKYNSHNWFMQLFAFSERKALKEARTALKNVFNAPNASDEEVENLFNETARTLEARSSYVITHPVEEANKYISDDIDEHVDYEPQTTTYEKIITDYIGTREPIELNDSSEEDNSFVEKGVDLINTKKKVVEEEDERSIDDSF